VAPEPAPTGRLVMMAMVQSFAVVGDGLRNLLLPAGRI
jgi:hypothetical protein